MKFFLDTAKRGSHIVTLPYKVFEQLFRHPLTDRGPQGFLSDWERARQVLGDVFAPAAARKTGP
ncbi:MAG: hypothetical protein ACLP1Y_09450 [Candidatus Acidiferrales bacterium]